VSVVERKYPLGIYRFLFPHIRKEGIVMPKEKARVKVKPVQEIRLGRIKAAIWANETDNGIRHNVTFSRLYKPEGGDWQDSTSFGRDDLPLVAKVADMVHTWIFEQSQEKNGSHQAEQQNGSSKEDF
jgi:hypothetical protein